jgi:hypothetical protein
MKYRNKGLYAEAAAIAALKLQIPCYKEVAERHGASLSSVRQVVSATIREMKKRANVEIHVEPRGESSDRIDGCK